MLNKLLKNFYGWMVSIISKMVSLFPVKREITYLLSFPQNDTGLISQLNQLVEQDRVTICYTSNCVSEAIAFQKKGIQVIALDNPYQLFFRAIPALTRSRVIICDNYFALLANLSLTKQTTVYQIWHANGAIKSFGWEDSKTAERSQRDRKRFQMVYDSFDQIVVGSDEMAEVFKKSYHLPNSRILRSGVPRTDYFFNPEWLRERKKVFNAHFPEAKGKQIILYAPTYRDGPLNSLNLRRLAESQGKKAMCLYKFHPHTELPPLEMSDNVTDLRGLTLEEVLPSVDILITDYSSIPFEYSLVKPEGRVLFYCYDLEDYQKSTGIQEGFIRWAQPGMCKSEEEVLHAISDNEGLTAASLNVSWNKYNDGNATKRFIAIIQKKLKE